LAFSLKRTPKIVAEDPFVSRVKVVLKKCGNLRLEAVRESLLIPALTRLLELGKSDQLFDLVRARSPPFKEDLILR
jgi:hypothetical protein